MATPAFKDEEDRLRNMFKVREDEAPFMTLHDRTSVCKVSSGGYDDSLFTQNILLDIPWPIGYEIHNSTPRYDLSDLCDSSKVGKEDSNEVSPERVLSKWLENNFGVYGKFASLNEYQQVPIFKHLAPFLSSNAIKSDICLLNDFIPLFLCEVHSSNYISDIAKCVISLIYQLRLLRHFDPSINYVHGFVFPNQHKPTLVTKVKVEWKELAFCANYTYLEKKAVKEHVNDVLQEQCTRTFHDHKNPVNLSSYFMPLTKSELELIRAEMKCGSALQQVQSKFSILVKDDVYYYKLITTKDADRTLLALWGYQLKNGKDIQHLCLPVEYLEVYRQRFFKFESHPYQFLTPEEAKLCLGDFTTQAFAALKEFHGLGLAHTDVRLPNMVFAKNFKLKLIDFDRATAIESRGIYSKSFSLHRPPEPNYTAMALDYKQLGFLILSIFDRKNAKETLQSEEEHRTTLEREYPFLSRLIYIGEFDSDLCEKFVEIQKNEKTITIAEVLSSRV